MCVSVCLVCVRACDFRVRVCTPGAPAGPHLGVGLDVLHEGDRLKHALQGLAGNLGGEGGVGVGGGRVKAGVIAGGLGKAAPAAFV